MFMMTLKVEDEGYSGWMTDASSNFDEEGEGELAVRAHVSRIHECLLDGGNREIEGLQEVIMFCRLYSRNDVSEGKHYDTLLVPELMMKMKSLILSPDTPSDLRVEALNSLHYLASSVPDVIVQQHGLVQGLLSLLYTHDDEDVLHSVSSVINTLCIEENESDQIHTAFICFRLPEVVAHFVMKYWSIAQPTLDDERDDFKMPSVFTHLLTSCFGLITTAMTHDPQQADIVLQMMVFFTQTNYDRVTNLVLSFLAELTGCDNTCKQFNRAFMNHASGHRILQFVTEKMQHRKEWSAPNDKWPCLLRSIELMKNLMTKSDDDIAVQVVTLLHTFWPIAEMFHFMIRGFPERSNFNGKWEAVRAFQLLQKRFPPDSVYTFELAPVIVFFLDGVTRKRYCEGGDANDALNQAMTCFADIVEKVDLAGAQLQIWLSSGIIQVFMNIFNNFRGEDDILNPTIRALEGLVMRSGPQSGEVLNLVVAGGCFPFIVRNLKRPEVKTVCEQILKLQEETKTQDEDDLVADLCSL